MFLKIKDYLLLLRPHHWVKNLLVIAPSFFGGVIFSSIESVWAALIAFFSFSFASSAGYIINDLRDIKSDINHPKKKNRPIASGRIGTKEALFVSLVILAISFLLSLKFSFLFILIVLAYLLLTVAYSFGLKNIVIIDAFCIAGGFIFRISAGGVASGVDISSWLFLTTLFLSLLLAFGKRRSEFNIQTNANNFRKVLKGYEEGFLDNALAVFATTSIVTYSIYLISNGPKILITTIPFVSFGVLRYLYLVQVDSKGDPTEVLLKDIWLLVCVFLWLIITGVVIYSKQLFGFTY